MELTSQYYTRFAAAYVRGMALQSAPGLLPPALLEKPLDALDAAEAEEILQRGRAGGCKLYYFKRTHGDLPRVRRVLGFLQSIPMESLLDAGSGRGVFLWPCLDAFPGLRVMSLDLLPHRVALLQAVRAGGIGNLTALEGDLCRAAVGDKSHDVVTLLEVLEHIPDVAAAVGEALRIARHYVVVTVPSKPDNNPEHIRLLTKEMLTELFSRAGCARLHFDGVPGHLVMTAVLEGAT